MQRYFKADSVENITPFRSYRNALQERYGAKTYKLTLSGGRTCPTRDGSFGPKKGWGGCSFCDIHGSASYFANENKKHPIRLQLDAASNAIRTRYKAEKFIAYFQSYTTTHQEIEEYKHRYDEAVRYKDVVALAVGTRPDCLPDEVLDVLCSYLDRVDVYLELGVQSLQDEVLDWFERGHDVACAVNAMERSLTRAKKLSTLPHRFDISAHLIIGAPMETEKNLIDAALKLNSLGIHGVKIHHLHILKKTKLAARYQKNEFSLLEMDDYLERVANFIRHLSPEIIIHRTHGLAPHPEELIGPAWSMWKAHPAEKLKVMMRDRGWKQGDLLTP